MHLRVARLASWPWAARQAASPAHALHLPRPTAFAAGRKPSGEEPPSPAPIPCQAHTSLGTSIPHGFYPRGTLPIAEQQTSKQYEKADFSGLPSGRGPAVRRFGFASAVPLCKAFHPAKKEGRQFASRPPSSVQFTISQPMYKSLLIKSSTRSGAQLFHF